MRAKSALSVTSRLATFDTISRSEGLTKVPQTDLNLCKILKARTAQTKGSPLRGSLVILSVFKTNKGITFVPHPHSGWLSVSRGALNCLKALKQRTEPYRVVKLGFLYCSSKSVTRRARRFLTMQTTANTSQPTRQRPSMIKPRINKIA